MSDEDFKRNELVVRSGQRIAVGDKWLDIRDNGGPVSFVDIITEARHNTGVVCLAFGSAIVDGNNSGICDIASRLRMNMSTAQLLHRLLGDMIADALKPADLSKAN
ncbi:hypothetical protein [Rhizobium sp. IBUN]|uniref:hypothetical protein n=1 Tax=Rhizobium sp. IBUN TaxID=1042326 RepID=UPI0004004A5E|nr:hypothetical protein [Rhizobium sp. IBUN]